MMLSLLLLFFFLVGGSNALWAQRPAAADASQCEHGVVSVVFVDNHSIFDASDPEREARFDWAYRLANSLHVRTREQVIERELLVRPGDCLDPFLLEESERLLRGYEFLSRVDIFALPQPDGTHHVIVDTQDEWSTQFDLRVGLDGGVRFDGLGLRELNLLGTGRTLEFFYRERDANREYGVGYATPQLFRSRWDMRLAGGRTRAGVFVRETIAYPFVGEVGRWAAKQSFLQQDRYFEYARNRPDEGHLLLPVSAHAVAVAAIGRSGRIGRLTTFGAALSYTGLGFPGGLDAIESVDGGDYGASSAADSAAVDAVRRQVNEVSAPRLLFLLGRRRIGWVKRRGLDSMRGEQDIRLGSEIELAFGPSFPGRRGSDDIFGGIRLYGGIESGSVLVTGRARLDGRHALGGASAAARWKDVFADGELIGYWRPRSLPRHTFVVRGAGAGGWQTRTPFQLTLGGELGLRGYDRFRFPGGRRVIISAEDRVYFGWPFREVLDLGGTLFADVGRMWPGDAPFGTESGWRAAGGLGLRGAFPAGGRTTYRVDLAWPVAYGASWRDVRLIVSLGELLGLDTRARDEHYPDSRQLGLTGEVFHFPR